MTASSMASANTPGSGKTSYFGRRRLGLIAFLVVMFVGAFGLRLINLTNPPLDFQPMRQLHGAIVARGMYYQMLPGADPLKRAAAMAEWHSEDLFEPQIDERIVAITYLIAGGEYPWIARIYSALFWIIGGLFLFDLARRLTNVDGAVAATAFYLFDIFGVIASRSFQPDPFMIMGLLAALWSLVIWLEAPSWKWSLLAGIIGGIAILIKMVAVFMLGPVAMAAVWVVFGFKKALVNRQVWAAAGLMVVIPLVAFLFNGQPSGFFDFWVLKFRGLLAQPSFYFTWLGIVRSIADLGIVFVSLAGLFLADKLGKAVLGGLWVGFILYGLVFPEQIHTHDYYNLPVVPIIALGLAPVAALALAKLSGQPRFWQAAFLVLAIGGMIYPSWLARNVLVSSDYHNEGAAWLKMGHAMPTDGTIIALTHDSGKRIKYYGWKDVALWPSAADLTLTVDRGGNNDTNFDHFFTTTTSGMSYFLVTQFGEFDAQPQLKALLNDHYPVYAKGDGYVLYDLRNKK